jgi:hypothetical protein
MTSGSKISEKVILIYSSYGLWPILEYEIEIAQQKLKEGHRVIFITCNGNVPSCQANKKRNGKPAKRYCWECKSRVKKGLDWLENRERLTVLNGNNQLQADQIDDVNKKLKDIKNYIYDQARIKLAVNIDNIDIYESSLSGLVTDLYVSKPDLVAHKNELILQLRVGLESYYSALNYTRIYQPDEIYIYNARFAKYRPLFRVAKSMGIVVWVYEYPYSGYENYLTIRNEYPHNFPNTSKLLKQLEENANHSETKKIEIGDSWFKSRIFAKEQLEEPMMPSYNHLQKAGELGEWDENKYNIAFFISSEHEICHIKEVKETQPYDQISCIRTLISITDVEIIHIRIHPNLEGKDINFLNEILEFKGEARIKIIMPSSQISSYDLVSKSDLIVSYGSTIGIEAAYLKKPVITVGTSLYQEFKATLNIFDHKTLVNAIKKVKLGNYDEFPDINIRNIEACKYAYAFLQFGNRSRYLSRNSFSGGKFRRKGENTEISAPFWLRTLNRIIDLPIRLVKGFRLLTNSYKRKKFLESPLALIKKKLFLDLT